MWRNKTTYQFHVGRHAPTCPNGADQIGMMRYSTAARGVPFDFFNPIVLKVGWFVAGKIILDQGFGGSLGPR